ncbi:MAG TPA: hypothetical protein VJ836_02620 [Candidatus Saccharimonadales bacterium]|nr:hypothetical protein [Candidatus Saccharimonadales bacterium]
MSDSEDPVKKLFGKTAKEILSRPSEPHGKFHSFNAFCGNAGPEEMKHFQSLLDGLTDTEIADLTDAVGIKFPNPARDIERDALESALDEADREIFYREYHRLLEQRKL